MVTIMKLIQENTVYGSDGDISGVAVSTDGGATFTLIGESRYDLPSGTIFPHNYDLTGYDGQTVHLALVYQATNGNSWGVLDMAIRKSYHQ